MARVLIFSLSCTCDYSPLQDLEVASSCRSIACALVPPAAILYSPLQDLEVACSCRFIACVLVPWAAIRPQPLQHLEMAAKCCRPARALVQLKALVVQVVLEHVEPAAKRNRVRRTRIPLREPLWFALLFGKAHDPLEARQTRHCPCHRGFDAAGRRKMPLDQCVEGFAGELNHKGSDDLKVS